MFKAKIKTLKEPALYTAAGCCWLFPFVFPIILICWVLGAFDTTLTQPTSSPVNPKIQLLEQNRRLVCDKYSNYNFSAEQECWEPFTKLEQKIALEDINNLPNQKTTSQAPKIQELTPEEQRLITINIKR